MIHAQGKYLPNSTVTTHATFYDPLEYATFALTWPCHQTIHLARQWTGSTTKPSWYHYLLTATPALLTWIPGALLLAYYAAKDKTNHRMFKAKFPHEYQATQAKPNYFNSPLED